MKQILTVYTGGTIGCAPQDGVRALNAAVAKRAIAAHFANSDSVYAPQSDTLFVDSDCPLQTLSENMTLSKLQTLIAHLRSFDLTQYAGVIVLHGTDTLAFTAALLSFVLCDTPVPVMLASGNRPPTDEQSNANANFRTAVELILSGISPNVYVPYRNMDGTMWLHRGSTLLQCPTCSEDFRNARPDHAVAITSSALPTWDNVRAPCEVLSRFSRFSDAVTLLYPYTGLCYRHVHLDGMRAVIHGTYHSGTVCVERNAETERFSDRSIVWLLEKCRTSQTPVLLAPCALDESQYSSTYDAVKNGAVPLSMTTEAAYCKALLGVSCGLTGSKLIAFMKTELNHEMI